MIFFVDFHVTHDSHTGRIKAREAID